MKLKEVNEDYAKAKNILGAQLHWETVELKEIGSGRVIQLWVISCFIEIKRVRTKIKD
jgi:hypothetical protein